MNPSSTPAVKDPKASAAPLPARSDFPHFLAIPTRWMDNDVYGHVNNVVYCSYFDTVINEWLIRAGGLDIHDGAAVGYCVESQCAPASNACAPDRPRNASSSPAPTAPPTGQAARQTASEASA